MKEFIKQLDLNRPQKHSLTLRGHRTSVSLEAPFWKGFIEIAHLENVPINVLAAQIDASRGTDAGLASAIRVFVLTWHQSRDP
jgi:predicted DNA-binding ribbon-helix-helix protein